MQQQSTISSSCYSNNNIEPPFFERIYQREPVGIYKFKSAEEFVQPFNLFENNDQRIFKFISPPKLGSQPYINKSPLYEEDEIEEFFDLSQIIDQHLLGKKEIFKSIESIRLDKLDSTESQSHKKSSPPPGFETQFPQDQTKIGNQLSSIAEQSLATKISLTKNNQQCKVIYIRGLDHPSLTLQALYNIFSNFGMIMRILFFRQKGAMLIQFFSGQQAQQCKEWMNGVTICGNAIRIFDSNHKEIKQKSEIWNAGEFWERDLLCKDRGKQSNPPSEVVHVANLRPEACSQEVILSLFGTVGFVQNIKFLLDDPFKKMCFIKFKTIEESLNAIAFLHGYWLYGRLKNKLYINDFLRQIQVSFTRSKI